MNNVLCLLGIKCTKPKNKTQYNISFFGIENIFYVDK